MSSAGDISTEGRRAGANLKGLVVKAGAKYGSEQGSDYDPGISAETVGSKVVFLGIVTLPAGARTRAHVHERRDRPLWAQRRNRNVDRRPAAA